ncbi:MAG: hypothetical protein LBC28_04035 [Oscillospiraceae bacterium]|jgi:hypothetical protein|nr:hypothetical protein [Oscillospiraceae bacterium]
MNRYIGNTGRVYRVDDLPEPSPTAVHERAPAARVSPAYTSVPSLPFGLEPGDIALLLLFFLLYIESGDEEFLIILVALAAGLFIK